MQLWLVGIAGARPPIFLSGWQVETVLPILHSKGLGVIVSPKGAICSQLPVLKYSLMLFIVLGSQN